MSLINQMLRDLESRDSSQLEEPGLDGLAWSASGGGVRNPRRWLPGLGALLVAGAVAVLAWRGLSPMPGTEAPVAVAPPVEVARAAAEPAAAPAAAPRESRPAVAPAPVAVARPAAPVVRAAEPEPEPEQAPASPGRIVKQARPLSAAEQAARFYQQGYDYLLAQRYAESEQALRRALAADPRHGQAREMLVGQLIRRGELTEAGALLREGLGLEPRNAHFAKLYARLLVEQNAVPTAIHILTSARPPIARDPEYNALLAALYQRQGRHRDAAALYRDLVKLRADVAVWWVGLAVSLESLGRPVEAKVAYERAAKLRLGPDLRRYVETRLHALREAGS